MNSKLFVLIAAVLIAIFATLAFAELAPEDSSPGVVDLTPENFDSIVDGSKHVLVEFYAPWCGHCKRLAADYAKLGETVTASKADIVIAKVNADVHREIGARFGVKGFPTIKYFPKGSTEATEYSAGRTVEDFLNFLTEKTGARLAAKKAPSDVVILTDATFESVVLDSSKDVLVEFYAPWCGHCKKLAPEYEKVATTFKNDNHVVIANIDADKYRSIGEKFGVTGFPTIKFFPKTSKAEPTPYEGARSAEAFVDFINDKTGTFRVLGGKLNDQAGKIASFDVLAKEFSGAASADERTAVVAKTEQAAASSSDANAKYYHKVMVNITNKGAEYVEKEKDRLRKVLEAGTAANLDSFQIRLNILSSF